MKVAPLQTLPTLLTLFNTVVFILFKLLYTAETEAWMPVYIVREWADA